MSNHLSWIVLQFAGAVHNVIVGQRNQNWQESNSDEIEVAHVLNIAN